MSDKKDQREHEHGDTDEICMYLLANTDLGMSKGKLAAQVGHAVGEITERIIRSGYEQTPLPEEYKLYQKWKMDGTAKVTLKATEKQMRELMKLPNTCAVIDQGRTQIPENSLTVVGFYPQYKSKMFPIVKGYKLL